MSVQNPLLLERFEKFKQITQEEEIIIEQINAYLPKLDPENTVLDIGCAGGAISHALQPNSQNITLIDIDEFDIKSNATFIKNTWEKAELDKVFDVIIASHVWGHFHHTNTTKKSFDKAAEHLTPNGKLILCYNTNKDFLGRIVEFANTTFNNFQFDIFDERLTKKLTTREVIFDVKLEARNFDELTDLLQVLLSLIHI